MGKKMQEYSKKIISAMITLWFLGGVFGGYMVYVSGSELSALLNYIGAPMTAGLVGYLFKAAFENKEKIRGSTGLTEYCQSGPSGLLQKDPLNRKGE